MRLWQKLGIRGTTPDPPARLPRGISRAGLDGAPFAELCDELFLSLEPALRAKAECFAVVLLPANSPQRPDPDQIFDGRLWINNTRQEWSEDISLGALLSIPPTLFQSTAPVEQPLDAKQASVGFGPLTGMRNALYIPLRDDRQTFGVIFAATSRTPARFPRNELARAAAEFSVVLALRATTSAFQTKSSAASEARKIWARISSGASLDQLLGEICDSSLHSAVGSSRSSLPATPVPNRSPRFLWTFPGPPATRSWPAPQ